MNHQDALDFEQFVLGSGRRLMRTAVLLTGDNGHAEDLVQTALERTATHWTRLDGAPEAYARTVLARLAIDRWRRARSRVEEVLGEPPERASVDVMGQVVVRQALITAMRALTPRQRAVVVLRYFEDLSEQETARVLAVSQGTVKATASRAVGRLRELAPDLNPAQAALEVTR